MNNAVMKHKSIYKITIIDIFYTRDKNRTTCIIKAKNNATGSIFKVKGYAYCNDSKFDILFGTNLAESRAKICLYNRYVKDLQNIVKDVIDKHRSLALKERHHTNKLIDAKYGSDL